MLSRPRSFYVHITGASPTQARAHDSNRARQRHPRTGLRAAIRCNALAGTRSSHGNPGCTICCFFLKAYRAEASGNFVPALRNVLLHRNGTTLRLDLLRYYTTGSLTQNPYLEDGDVVEVPAFHVQRDAVTIQGPIPYPGAYDVRPDDTVLDLLAVAAGPDGLRRLKEVRLVRRSTPPQLIALDTLLAHPERPLRCRQAIA